MYHHDGEQLLFYKKVHIKTQSKKNVFVMLYIIARNEELQSCATIYMIKTILKRNLKRTLNAIIQHEEN